MLLSDVSVKRPVFAIVVSLLLIIFGIMAFLSLPLRQYPDIDPPVVSITTDYPGASANIIDTQITALIERRIAGIEGIDFISSSSEAGRSKVEVQFRLSRNVDDAANDIRDRISQILDNLPEEANPPEVEKVDSNDDVILWLNLTSDQMSVIELTDYARRFLQDRFGTLDGVARVRVGGGLEYAMRIWLDRQALAARNLTVADVEAALRRQNVELPAGSLESTERQFTLRIARQFKTPEDFQQLVITQGEDGYLVRLGDIGRVELTARESRTFFRGNQVPMVGIGIVKQSTANTLAVVQAAKAQAKQLNATLPEGMKIVESYDTSVFIQGAIDEVYKTLGFAIVLVILVLFLFLGSVRATLIPAVTVPVSIIATFTALYAFGFSVNLLTLLALVLAVGLVVDDAIVVLENVYRRIQLGESPLVAAYLGTRQVGFAVIATTLSLVAVFVPIAFLEGDIGRLFSEFALTLAVAVGFSSLVALTLSPVLASKFLRPVNTKPPLFVQVIDSSTLFLQNIYRHLLRFNLRFPYLVIVTFLALIVLTVWLLPKVPSEYAPREDRGAFFVLVNGPEGATYNYMLDYMNEIEKRLMPYVETGEVTRLLVRAPRAFGNLESFNSGIIIVVLNDWGKRRNGFVIMDEVRSKLADLPGVRAFPVMRQGFGSAVSKPVQFVIQGSNYEELQAWRDIIQAKIDENNPGLAGVDFDYKETRPQMEINIDTLRAADLGVDIENISRTLETFFASRRVTTYIDRGEEYDVVLEGENELSQRVTDIKNLYVRNDRGQLIPLSQFVTIQEFADAATLNRYNRLRAITLEANLAEGYTLGEALDYLNNLVKEHLPETASVDYKGQSKDFQSANQSFLFIFLLGVVIVYLVLAAQFESFVHPFVVLLTVPLAVLGALGGLWLSGNSLNLYSQIGLVMLVGLATKNGILIVEFINQLRDEGMAFFEAIVEASVIRLRPILMTAITTVIGAIPLLLSTGPGAETRAVVGLVIFYGVLFATFLTLLVIPVAYRLLAFRTGSPEATAKRLAAALKSSSI